MSCAHAMQLPGIIHHLETAQIGLERRDVRRLLTSGVLHRAGDFLHSAHADERILPFLAHGLRPTCTDAAELHGLWVPVNHRPHAFHPRCSRRSDRFAETRIAPIAARAGRVTPSRPVLHAPVLRAWPDHDPVPALPLVLNHAARCLSTSSAAILFESALHQGKLGYNELPRLLAELPFDRRTALSRVDGRAESGTETAVRWWLKSQGVRVEPQVTIPGVGRVDLLVGANWVIECDSRSFHTADEHYHRDRERDLALRALGYVVTRLTWEQVFLRWGETRHMLQHVIRRRDHRRPRRG